MAYIKHGTGPNDHKKGNRTRGENRKGNRAGHKNVTEAELAGLKENSAAYEEQKEHYKRIAERRAGLIRYGQDYAVILADNLNRYIEEKQDQRRPITKAGLIRASGLSADTYYRYRSGEADHLLYEFMDLHDIDYEYEGQLVTIPAADNEGEEGGKAALLIRLSDLIKRAELAMQEQLEENCYLNKGNPLGSIAGMRNYFDWQENPSGPNTTNNTLVLNNVATLEEAREAMKRLNG